MYCIKPGGRSDYFRRATVEYLIIATSNFEDFKILTYCCSLICQFCNSDLSFVTGAIRVIEAVRALTILDLV